MKEKIEVLDELNKGACMGIDAINYIVSKIDEEDFIEVLKKQYNDYKEIKEEIEKLYPEDEKKPHETNRLEKTMTFYGVQMNTMMDSSTSHIAEILINGTNMGITEGVKIINNKDLDDETLELAKKYVSMQENAIEKLKEFL